MNNNYENKILDAIQTLVDNAVSNAGYDKTIKAVISKCVNQNTGKYVVRYQDSSFYAYSNDLDSIYSGGTSVYVLVPGNDMSQTKTILGSVDKLGTEYISLSESNSAYQEIGTSIVTPNGTIPGISSYKKNITTNAQEDSVTIYDREDVAHSTVAVDTDGAEIYFQNAQYIEIGGTFTTRLNEEQKRRGNYGLVFDMDFKNGEDVVNKKYVIDINSMTGNPYSYNYGSAQTAIFQIDGANFYRLNSITLECKNFPHTATPANADIFVEDIVLKALTPLTRDEIANNSLTFITKQGIYFNTDDSADATRLIETEVKINKKVVPNTGGLLRFYWFKEDSTVGITSPDYLPFGGPGWKCINTYNVIDETNDIRDYITDVDTLTVVKSGNPAKENEYKCVVIYNDEIQVERNIIIYNQASEYTITIESDQGNYFKYNEGNPTLTCSVNPTGTYTYIWTETNSANRTEVLTETSNTYSIQLSNIANFSKFTCSVYSSGNFVGKSDIVITNSWDSEDNNYALVMENGDQIFKYNEKGIAPTNKSLEKPIVLKPLQFTLYDEMGHQVDDNKILSTDVFWYVPKEDTMIKVSDAGITPTEEDGYLVYSGLKTLNFTIANIYNIKKLNNTIKLVVKYNDRVLNTISELEFIKEGEIGSNGTDFVCRIVPNVASGGAVPAYPIFTANMSANPVVGDMNYNRPSGQSDKWFKVQLYKDGVQIYEGIASGTSEENKSVTIEWSMLKNKYTSSIVDSSSFTVNSSTGAFTYVDLDDDLDRAANLVKVTVSYDGATYYATIPIILVQAINAGGNTYTMDLVENTGFRYVMYSTDGLNPLYDSSNPFALKAYRGTTDITEDSDITFTYSTLGQTYNGTTWVDENNFITKTHGVSNPLAKNEADYRPIEKFNGLSVNNAVKCIVKDDNVEIVRAYLPIHFYLNRFGNAALNGWDGNHIEINNNGGFILAPQVGAGKKENDNSYTGIFMGNVREAGSNVDEVGLYGYYKGTRTIALDTKDGSARFGKQGAGQIVIDPASADYSGKGTARLYSNDYVPNYTAPSAMVPAQTKYTAGFSYWRKVSNTEYRLLKEGTDYTIGNTIANIDYVWDGGTGLEIDLNDPHIRFGSGKFRVDSDGQVYATGFVTVNNLEAGDYNIPGVENWKVISATDIAQFETNAEHYPPANTSEAIVCQCSYKDTIVATSGYSAVFATSAGVNIGATQTIDNISGAITQLNNNTTLTFSVSESGKITNATNTFYVKFTHTSSGLSVLKAFNINLIILGKDGEPGEQGPAGPAGKDGTSVTVKGTYNSIQDLCAEHPSGNTLGDGYVIGLDLYVFTNGHSTGGSDPADWNNVGQFKGEDAKRCFLVASSEVFKSTDGGTTYAPSSVTISPYIQAVSITGLAYSTDGGVNFTPLTTPYPTGISISNNIITLSNSCELFNTSSTVAFKCITDDNNIYDIITITKIQDGLNGTDAYTVVLSNESHTFAATNSAAVAGSATTEVLAYKGATAATPTIGEITGQVTGLTTSVSGSTITITVTTDLTTTEGVLTIPVTVDNKPFTKKFSWSLAKAGTDGTSPTAYSLIVSHAAIAKSQAGVYNPTSLTFSATSQTGNTAITTYTDGSYRITKDGGTAGAWANIAASNTYNVTSNAPTTSVKIELAKENASSGTHTIVDAQTVPIVKDGKGISSITNYYLATSASSGVTRETSGWTTSVQSMTETNKYLWNYEDILYNDNSHTYSDPSIIGVYGETGAAGKGISAIDEYYAINNSSTTAPADSDFSTTVVSPTESNPYLWNYEKITYVNPSSTENTAKHIIGHFGKNGENGTSPYIAYLTNEAQTFASGTAATATTQLYAYQGTTEKSISFVSIGTYTFTSSTVINTNYDTGKANMQFSVDAKSGTHPTISFKASSSLAQSVTEQIPIVYKIADENVNRTIYFSYSSTKTGSSGADAKLVTVNPSSQVFKSTEGASGTFTPQYIYLYPYFQGGATYSKWQYSTNGTTWTNVTSGSNSLTIGTYNSVANTLRIERTCNLYTNSVTAISFKCVSDIASIYDTVTVTKIYDVTELEIGGRNYVSNSVANWQSGNWSIPSVGDETSIVTYANRISLITPIEVEPSTDYWIKVTSTKSNIKALFRVCDLDDKFIRSDTNLSNQKWTSGANDKFLHLTIYDNSSLSDIADGTTKIKLEKGNLSTDWTMSQEDIEATYDLAQSVTITYTTTDTSESPGDDVVWTNILPSSPNKFIWQRTTYSYLDSSKNNSVDTCIYTPVRIDNELQYCLCSSRNYSDPTPGSEYDWRSESFPWDDTYATSSGSEITILKYQFVRNKYTDKNKTTDAVTYSTPILDQAWYMFGLKIASEKVAREALENNINNNIIKMDAQTGLTVSSADNLNGIRLTNWGIQFLSGNDWVTVWDIKGNLDASLINVTHLKAEDILSGTLTLDPAINDGKFYLSGTQGSNTTIDGDGVKVTNTTGDTVHIQATSSDGISAKTASNEEYFNIDPGTKQTTMTNGQINNDLGLGENIKITQITHGIAFIGIYTDGS